MARHNPSQASTRTSAYPELVHTRPSRGNLQRRRFRRKLPRLHPRRKTQLRGRDATAPDQMERNHRSRAMSKRSLRRHKTCLWCEDWSQQNIRKGSIDFYKMWAKHISAARYIRKGYVCSGLKLFRLMQAENRLSQCLSILFFARSKTKHELFKSMHSACGSLISSRWS